VISLRRGKQEGLPSRTPSDTIDASPDKISFDFDRFLQASVFFPPLSRCGAGTRLVALAIVFCGWLSALLGATASQAADTREKAVAAAREGHAEEAISALRKLLDSGTDDPLVAYDLAVILTWVNRPREATDTFERASAAEVPP
jgi:hypothetical protein